MYEGITAMLNRKNMTIIRLIEQTVITQEFRKTVSKHWNDYEKEEMPDYDKEKLRIIKEHYQEFLTWICDTYLVSQEENKQFCRELEKYIEKVFLETGNYLNMMEDLIGSKYIIISKVCPPCKRTYAAADKLRTRMVCILSCNPYLNGVQYYLQIQNLMVDIYDRAV